MEYAISEIYGPDLCVTRGWLTTSKEVDYPDFIHVHADNIQYGHEISSTLMEIIRHSDSVTDSIPVVLDELQALQWTIRRTATSWTRSPVYQEYHNHRDGKPSVFIFARASLTADGLVDSESIDFDIVFVRSRITIGCNIPTAT